ncbi:MAG: insulinase family protein [Candidatus Izimaplasma sp.]|nr:insulinase family protein [Candidatus Izimaplasma bacterium]
MIKNKLLTDEFIYYEKLENGLEVYIHPKKEHIDNYCALQVNFGGQDLEYNFNALNYSLPAGTAHFLEHVYFESDGQNLSDEFADKNADINAYTTREVTKYYFNSQENFVPLLKRFLEHFSKVNISEETIKKERNIIKKEILMYEDNLYNQVNDELLKQMYLDEKVWIDLAGTIDSVNKINSYVLKQAIEHFYRPNNMILIVTSNYDPELILDVIKASNFNQNKSISLIKPNLIFNLGTKTTHDIVKLNKNQKVSYAMLGIKIDLGLFDKVDESLKRLAIILFFEYHFSESSKNYEILDKEKLINYMYNTNVKITEHYAYFTVGSESNNPKKLIKRIKELLRKLEPIEEDIFLAHKHSRIGNFIGYFENVYKINYILSDLILKNINIYDYLAVISSIKSTDIEITKQTIKSQNILSVIYTDK